MIKENERNYRKKYFNLNAEEENIQARFDKNLYIYNHKEKDKEKDNDNDNDKERAEDFHNNKGKDKNFKKIVKNLNLKVKKIISIQYKKIIIFKINNI